MGFLHIYTLTGFSFSAFQRMWSAQLNICVLKKSLPFPFLISIWCSVYFYSIRKKNSKSLSLIQHIVNKWQSFSTMGFVMIISFSALCFPWKDTIGHKAFGRKQTKQTNTTHPQIPGPSKSTDISLLGRASLSFCCTCKDLWRQLQNSMSAPQLGSRHPML